MNNKIHRNIWFFGLLISLMFAGDEARIGTGAGMQLLVPVGARGIAMSGADIAYSSGLESIYWNPAGLGSLEGPSGLVSNMTMFNDISVNYFATGATFGKVGQFALSIKSIDMGNIGVTTVEDMDGNSGAVFSPTLATIGLTYGKTLQDRVNVGVTMKTIYESIPRALAQAYAFDIGVQYSNLANISGLGLALVLKNIGTNMHYSGSALTDQATGGNDLTDFYNREASSDPIPSTYSMCLSYRSPMGVTLGGTFISHNFSYDEVSVGGEYVFSNMLYLRGGLLTGLVDEVSKDDVLYSMSFGAGIKYKLMGMILTLDYTYRGQKFFDGNQLFSLGVQY